jgi:hypothetical protein
MPVVTEASFFLERTLTEKLTKTGFAKNPS